VSPCGDGEVDPFPDLSPEAVAPPIFGAPIMVNGVVTSLDYQVDRIPDGRHCVAVCRDCAGIADDLDPLVMPFSAHEPRDEWADEHERSPRHRVIRLEGWPTMSSLVSWLMVSASVRESLERALRGGVTERDRPSPLQMHPPAGMAIDLPVVPSSSGVGRAEPDDLGHYMSSVSRLRVELAETQRDRDIAREALAVASEAAEMFRRELHVILGIDPTPTPKGADETPFRIGEHTRISDVELIARVRSGWEQWINGPR
jgi:hypothetical protein